MQQLINNKCEGDKIVQKGHHSGTLMKNLSEDIQYNNDYYKLINVLPIDRAVFIDSTWNQSRGIYQDERVKRLHCVVIQSRISQFWRHQKGSPRWYLATIEAIHQFLVEIHVSTWGVSAGYIGIKYCLNEAFLKNVIRENDKAYNGQYDNLLFFFRHMYNLIHAYYNHDNLHAYKRRLM